MLIQDKQIHDPVADLHMVDAHMRWALLAAEEVLGHKGMPVVLREAGLAHLKDDYPPNILEATGRFTFADYANFSAALMNFFGRAGKSMTLRIGRLTVQHAVKLQSETFGLDTLIKASRVLPLTAQLKAGLMMSQRGLRKLSQAIGEERKLHLEDRGDKYAYIYETCPSCAGKEADTHICWIFNGVLEQSNLWLTGKQFAIEEVACRAMGDPACVWEISKTPRQS